MPAQIFLSQSGKPVGTPGVARDDFDLGTPVVAQVTGGPFIAQQWSFISKAIDVVTPAVSSAAFSAPTSPSTNVTPIDIRGTYLIQCTVDSGQGLGATPEDIAIIGFYAGAPLASNPAQVPRRHPAFGERREFNAIDALFPGGNPLGWAYEMEKWFTVIEGLMSGGGGVGDWTYYTALFTVGNGTGGTIGNGTITGRYRVVGKECEVENLLKWGSTTSFGSAPVPTLLITIPPGVTPDPTVMLQGFPNFGISACSITGIIGGFVSEGYDFYITIGNFGPPFGLAVALGVPAFFVGTPVTNDLLYMKTSFSIL